MLQSFKSGFLVSNLIVFKLYLYWHFDHQAQDFWNILFQGILNDKFEI